MEWESGSPCRSHTHPGQGRRFPGKGRGWELEFRDCGAIPGWGLLLTAERWIEGMWGRRSWWEMPVEENQAAVEAGSLPWLIHDRSTIASTIDPVSLYCWVTRKGWSHHRSLSLPTHQHCWLNSREAGSSNAELQNRATPRGPVSAWCAAII